MEIDRFQSEGKNLADEAKELFLDLWDDSLKLYQMTCYSYIDTSDNIFYEINTKTRVAITKESYIDYKDMFDLILRCGENFKYEKDTLLVNFDDIKPFIKEMKILKNSKKYNL